MIRTSAAFGAGTLAAILTALPAVPRVVEQGASLLLAGLALAGGSALVLGPALALIERARVDSTAFRAALLGLAWAAAPLSLFAETLKRVTHHRPLGAATFAVLSLGLAVALWFVAFRLFRFVQAENSPARRAAYAAALAAALASVAFTLFRAFGSSALTPHVLDGLRALATAALLQLSLRMPRVATLLGRGGLPLWAAVVVAGLVASSGEVGELVRRVAPVAGGPLAWF